MEFKNTGSKKNEPPAKGAKGLAPIELSLSPTLFNINLNIKRVSKSAFSLISSSNFSGIQVELMRCLFLSIKNA